LPEVPYRKGDRIEGCIKEVRSERGCVKVDYINAWTNTHIIPSPKLGFSEEHFTYNGSNPALNPHIPLTIPKIAST
jgi:hypothetical protein